MNVCVRTREKGGKKRKTGSPTWAGPSGAHGVLTVSSERSIKKRRSFFFSHSPCYQPVSAPVPAPAGRLYSARLARSGQLYFPTRSASVAAYRALSRLPRTDPSGLPRICQGCRISICRGCRVPLCQGCHVSIFVKVASCFLLV